MTECDWLLEKDDEGSILSIMVDLDGLWHFYITGEHGYYRLEVRTGHGKDDKAIRRRLTKEDVKMLRNVFTLMDETLAGE